MMIIDHMYTLLDFNYGSGAGYNSGFNFFGGSSGGGGGTGGGTANNAGTGGGTTFSGGNTSAANMPVSVDSLYSTLPPSSNQHIFAATATNPHYPHMRQQQPHGLSFPNGGGRGLGGGVMYPHAMDQQFMSTTSGHLVSRTGAVTVKKEPPDYYMDVESEYTHMYI